MKKILLILVVFVILFVFTGNQTCISENFTDICWSLQSSYTNDILKQNNKSISNLGLNEHINVIIEPLVKTDIIDKKLTLEKYLINKKVPSNKIASAVLLLKNIVNNKIFKLVHCSFVIDSFIFCSYNNVY